MQSRGSKPNPAEDVEMDLIRTAIPDDELREGTQLEEAQVPAEVPSAVRLATVRVHKNLGHPSKEIAGVALYELVEPIRLRSELRVKSSATFARRTKPPKKSLACEVGRFVHRIQSRCLSGSLCAGGLRRTSVFEFLNIVDLATRILHLLSSAIQKA